MLQTNTIEESTYKLLKELMQVPILENFFLVGGTNIALKLGHRKSIDLDFFTTSEFDALEIEMILKEKFNFQKEFLKGNTLKGVINGVKVDCRRYNYPILNKVELNDDIRMLALKDICAMKLSAIEHNGTRIKDYTDIAFLSEIFSFNQMAESYKQKFKTTNTFILAKSLLYFDDVDFNIEPVQLVKGSFNWGKIKKRLINMLERPNDIFSNQRIQLYDLPKRKHNDYDRSR